MTDTFRWGVIGTGGIASDFATDLALLSDATIVAVGSRRRQTADTFADQFGIPNRHGSYEELVADPEVDAVYVATPHPGHLAAALLAIAAGKAVLVEKPFTMNKSESIQLVEAARAKGVFLMEAMWTRFLPHMVAIRELLAAGRLGELRTVIADHGQWFALDPTHRIFAPELGGGALLDLGIYPVSLASMVLGTPTKITAVSDPAMTGVDGQTSMVLRDDAGRHAVLTTTSAAVTANTAVISGTAARIEIEGVWYRPVSFTIVDRDETRDRHHILHTGNGLRHQAAEVARCVRAGLLESPLLTLDETVSIMGTMDEIRAQIGLTYDAD